MKLTVGYEGKANWLEKTVNGSGLLINKSRDSCKYDCHGRGGEGQSLLLPGHHHFGRATGLRLGDVVNI